MVQTFSPRRTERERVYQAIHAGHAFVDVRYRYVAADEEEPSPHPGWLRLETRVALPRIPLWHNGQRLVLFIQTSREFVQKITGLDVAVIDDTEYLMQQLATLCDSLLSTYYHVRLTQTPAGVWQLWLVYQDDTSQLVSEHDDLSRVIPPPCPCGAEKVIVGRRTSPSALLVMDSRNNCPRYLAAQDVGTAPLLIFIPDGCGPFEYCGMHGTVLDVPVRHDPELRLITPEGWSSQAIPTRAASRTRKRPQ